MSEWHLARFHAIEEAGLGQVELEGVGAQLVVGTRLRLHLHELAQIALRQSWGAVSMQQLWNFVVLKQGRLEGTSPAASSGYPVARQKGSAACLVVPELAGFIVDDVGADSVQEARVVRHHLSANESTPDVSTA